MVVGVRGGRQAASRSGAHRSNMPLNIILQMANVVSAGMPTSHGRKYLVMRLLPIMSHGCTNLHGAM